MWIFINMIMEINVWLLNKKPNKSVKLHFQSLESLTCIEGVLLPILNLNAINRPSFILTDFSFKNPSPNLIFSQVFKTSYIFVITTQKESLSRGQFNFKLLNLSFILALFDSRQISVFELHRSVLVFKLNYFSS